MTKKVLIIEDRRDTIVFIANNILKPEGWDVITARDGELGLQKALKERPDLIITDLKLPKMHGLDVLEELNKRGLRIPTIVMTFHGSEETAIRAFRLGAIDYLIKPFEIEDMMSAIERALQTSAGGPPAGVVDAAVSEKLASQEREIQRLKSLLEQQETASPQGGQADATDVAHWQAMVRDRDAKLAYLKKQTINQHQAMSRQISHLQAQLVEKEAIVSMLQKQVRRAASSPGTQPEGSDLSPQSGEQEGTLAQANKLVETLTQAVTTHQQSLEKQRAEAERLARELHVLAAAIQMLGQSLSDQANQISNVLPGEK